MAYKKNWTELMNCANCKTEMVWGSDVDFQDRGFDVSECAEAQDNVAAVKSSGIFRRNIITPILET